MKTVKRIWNPSRTAPALLVILVPLSDTSLAEERESVARLAQEEGEEEGRERKSRERKEPRAERESEEQRERAEQDERAREKRAGQEYRRAAEVRKELHERVRILERKLKAAGKKESPERRELLSALEEARGKLKKLGRKGPARQQRAERAELLDRLRDLVAAGKQEEAARVKQELHEFEMQALKKKGFQPSENKGKGEFRSETKRRMHHLLVAIKNLKAGGFHEHAEQLAVHAKQLGREPKRERKEHAEHKHEHEHLQKHDGDAIHDLRRQLNEMRQEMAEMRQALKEFMDDRPKEK